MSVKVVSSINMNTEPRLEKMGLQTYASSKDLLLAKANSKASGKPAHPGSLVRSFAACFYKQKALIKLQANSKASGETVRMCRLA